MAIKFLNTVQVDTDVLYVKAANDRVGINTQNPGGELQVVGSGSIGNIYISANAAGSSVTDSLHIKKEALKASIINRDGGDLALGANNNEYVTIKGTGNVGIGTTSPQEKLHIYSTGAGPVRAEIETTQATDAIVKYTNSNRSYATFLTQTGQFSIYDYNAASHRFYMLTNGNIGINTTSPNSKLQVGGEIDANGGDGYRIDGRPWANWGSNGLTLGDWDGEGYATRIMGSNSSEVMRVTGTDVGIGTTSPSTKLEISSSGVNGVDISQSASNATQSGRLFFSTNTASEGFALFNSNGTLQINSGGIPNNTSGTNRISIIGSSGNVGIGTTSPQEKLHVNEAIPGTTLLEVENIRDNSVAGVKLTSASASYIAYTDAASNFAIWNNQMSKPNFKILDDGRVFIGIGDPTTLTEDVEIGGNLKANNYINQRVAWNSGFNHGGNNGASYYFIPVGYIAESTADTYYNNWIAPYAGRVRKIVLRNTGQSTVPTATTVNFRVSVNGSVVHTGSTITVTGSGLNILASETLSDTDAVFSATDRVQVAFRTNGLWRNAAAGISLEYTE